MVILLGLGIGAVFERFPLVHEVIKIAGIAYLLYLSWRIATSSPVSLEGGEGRPLTFWQAVLFQWVNPKAWVMAIGVAATYVNGGDPVSDAAIIAMVFVIAGLTSSQTWAAFGAGIGRTLGTGGRLRAFNVTMGLLLVACALWLVLDGQPPHHV